MKIIDLLNKMVNGEEVPLKIIVDGSIYKWDILEHFYAREDKSDLLELSTVFNTPEFLQMEVKVIEDEVDIDNIEELDTYETVETYDWQDVDTNRETINELVQAVKQLNKEIKIIKEK